MENHLKLINPEEFNNYLIRLQAQSKKRNYYYRRKQKKKKNVSDDKMLFEQKVNRIKKVAEVFNKIQL